MRLDIYVKDMLNISRQKAVELIKLSNITVNEKTVTKPSHNVEDEDIVKAENTDDVLKYVSRGGYKLEKAIDYFNISLCNKVCMDIGASTGGFTDCMLQHGALKVYAYDVGSNQLADKLKQDSRVVFSEDTDIRNVALTDKVDFISCDVSFISVKHIFEKSVSFLNNNGEAVFLIKPQFEAGKAFLNKNGIVKNPKVHKMVLKDIISHIIELGINVKGLTFSPIRGGDGNIEYLVYITKRTVDKYIDIDKYREKLIITRATKENINRIRKFNKDVGTPSAKWWNVIKLYIYALVCEDKETDVISYELIKDLLNTSKGGVKNASAQLRKIELYKQEYKAREVKHQNEKKEPRTWGLIHYIIDTGF